MIRNAVKVLVEPKSRKYIPTEKRYLVRKKKDNMFTYIAVFDKVEQRFVYSTDNQDEEKVMKDITRIYGSRNIKIMKDGDKFVEPIQKSKISKKSLLCEVVKEMDKLNVAVPLKIRKIKDVYRLIDKYKVNLKPKFEYNEEDNILSFELCSDKVEEGTHKIICNLNKGSYLYYFKDKLVENKDNLEDIFK